MAKAEKRIPVRKETFEALGEFKGAGETWDDVVRDLMAARRQQSLREMLARTDAEGYVALEDA